uniref:Uncharacterized protein n=1 Tax=viral metagenome TaxID=1070528 RepID=A0A6C0B1P1_9ZZZZ
MTTKHNARKETLCLLEENIKSKVLSGVKIPTKPQHKWRDVLDLIRRIITVIPAKQVELIRNLQQYSEMIRTDAPFVVKASYTRDMPFQTMRVHIGTIMEDHNVPIYNTRPYTINVCWQRHVIEVYHNIRYDSKMLSFPYECTNPCKDDLEK